MLNLWNLLACVVSWRWPLIMAAMLGESIACRASEQGLDFALDVRPILSDRCFLCHGPDEGTREADLRLDTADGIDYGFASGVFDESEAWRRIVSSDPDEQMPPPSLGKPLTSEERATLKRWMQAGAKWSEHWAFQPLRNPAPPAINSTAPQGWGEHAIDAFILRGLERAGLPPARRADRVDLLRRVTLDLTGLPPTLEQVDAFLADTGASAYERVVNRLLASQHFGERFASVWLDAARYSDTFGYQRDEDRFVWPWRDWVIRSINANLPYDAFLQHQLAGDLVEDPNTETILATTFNRLHGQNSEGGSIEEEFRAEYIADRTQTFAAAVLGLTMECCKCHDHKYDPLSQRDFYALSGFFDKIDEAGLSSFFTRSVPTPTLRLPSEAQTLELTRLQRAAADALRHYQQVVEAEQNRFAAGSLQSPVAVPEPQAANPFDANPGGANRPVPGVDGQAVRLSGDDEIKAAKGFAFERCDPFSLHLWVRAEQHHDRAVILHRSRAWTDSASRGYELLVEDGKPSAALVHFWPGNAIRVVTKEPLPLNRWTSVGITYDGSSRAEGLRMFVDGQFAPVTIVRDGLTKTMVSTHVNAIGIGARFRDRGFTHGAVDELTVFERQLSQLEVAALARQNLEAPAADQLWEHHRLAGSESVGMARDKLRAARQQLFSLEDQIPEIMAMRDSPHASSTRIRIRGAYDQLGDEVEPAVPEVLPALPPESPRNRLGLAAWATSGDNPLTARVAVNRFWQVVFGAGLVRTPEDFGAQGEPPTHPDLLDHLATRFVNDGWDVKALVRAMVLSATYQQTARSEISTAQDPTNRFWGRSTRRRWPAEMLRDNALAASGLLVDAMGGPPVKPYEVSASFKPSKPDDGDGLYRRSLYTYFKRSAPAPVLTAFDAPDRSVCRVQRERTKTPLQALVLLNGPQFVEAARVLAERAISRSRADDRLIVEHIFRSLTSQRPTPGELAVLVELLHSQHDRFAQDVDQAKRLLAVGARPPQAELSAVRVAAATIVAQTVMNYDKSVIRP